MRYAAMLAWAGLWVAIFAAAFGFTAQAVGIGAMAEILHFLSWLLGTFAFLYWVRAGLEVENVSFQRALVQIRKLDLRPRH